jgi:hypothetical protein
MAAQQKVSSLLHNDMSFPGCLPACVSGYAVNIIGTAAVPESL